MNAMKPPPEYGKWFELGVKEGRRQEREKIIEALDLRELIAEAIALHEEQKHD